jgi:DNA invertase Pin-like site-specific DNA recombinase
LDTTTPAGKALFQMMGVFAEFERAMIQERVRAGLSRASPLAPTLIERRVVTLNQPVQDRGAADPPERPA